MEAHFGQSDRVCGEAAGLGGEEEEEEDADDDEEKWGPRLSILLSLSTLAGSSHHSMARVVRERCLPHPLPESIFPHPSSLPPSLPPSLPLFFPQNNNCFLVKRGRTARVGSVQFSNEPFNLMKKNSFKNSGLANSKAIDLSVVEGGKHGPKIVMSSKVGREGGREGGYNKIRLL